MSGVRTINDIRDRCVVDDITGCWHWRGAFNSGKNGSRLPVTYLPALETVMGVQRAVSFLRTGAPLPEGHLAWACCATSQCCFHIATGTHRELGAHLARTGRRKGKISYLLGAKKHPNGRQLKPEIVADIRSSDETGRALAKRLKIAESVVSRVRRGETYRQEPIASVFGWAGLQARAA